MTSDSSYTLLAVVRVWQNYSRGFSLLLVLGELAGASVVVQLVVLADGAGAQCCLTENNNVPMLQCILV